MLMKFLWVTCLTAQLELRSSCRIFTGRLNISRTKHGSLKDQQCILVGSDLESRMQSCPNKSTITIPFEAYYGYTEAVQLWDRLPSTFLIFLNVSVVPGSSVESFTLLEWALVLAR